MKDSNMCEILEIIHYLSAEIENSAVKKNLLYELEFLSSVISNDPTAGQQLIKDRSQLLACGEEEPYGLENLEKREHFFQSGKSQGILSEILEKTREFYSKYWKGEEI